MRFLNSILSAALVRLHVERLCTVGHQNLTSHRLRMRTAEGCAVYHRSMLKNSDSQRCKPCRADAGEAPTPSEPASLCPCAQLKDARSPCRTAGRRAGELLLAAGAGKLSWSQVLTGALTEPQLADAGVIAGEARFRSIPFLTLVLATLIVSQPLPKPSPSTPP